MEYYEPEFLEFEEFQIFKKERGTETEINSDVNPEDMLIRFHNFNLWQKSEYKKETERIRLLSLTKQKVISKKNYTREPAQGAKQLNQHFNEGPETISEVPKKNEKRKRKRENNGNDAKSTGLKRRRCALDRNHCPIQVASRYFVVLSSTIMSLYFISLV